MHHVVIRGDTGCTAQYSTGWYIPAHWQCRQYNIINAFKAVTLRCHQDTGLTVREERPHICQVLHEEIASHKTGAKVI